MKTHRKYHILYFVFILIMNSMIAQNEYYDAYALQKEIIGDSLTGEGAKILLKYLKFRSDNVDDSLKEMDTILDRNPFLPELKKISKSVFHSSLAGKKKSLLASVSGLDVTNVAHGISQFMIERAKQELTVAFFNRFKKFSETHEEFAILFPVTTDNLENLLAYNYPDMLPALRAGFLDDIKLITYQLDDVLELPKYHELLKNFPEIRVAIRSIRFVHELESGETHPSTLFEKFADMEEWTDPSSSEHFKNFGSVVGLAKVFSNSLRVKAVLTRDSTFIPATDTSRSGFSVTTREVPLTHAWISFPMMKQLIKDKPVFRIYLGLLYESVRREDITFYNANGPRSFHDLMGAQKDNLFLFENKVTEFIELANKVDVTLDTLKDKRDGRVALSNDELFSYIDVSLDVIEYGFSLGKVFGQDLHVDQYCKIARKANELYRNIYKQEYTQAVSNAADILDEVNFLIAVNKDEIRIELDTTFKREIFFKKPIDKLSDQESLALSVFDPEHVSVRTESLLKKYQALRETDDSFSKFSHIVAKTTRYGLFMANMVKAESADEVSALLETTVLPVGSSSIKKNSGFNMAIQSYLGGFGAFSKEDNDESSWNSPFGVIAPIGLAVSAGLGKGGALSLFLPLLDIGAVVDYQLKGSTIPSSTGNDSVVVTKDYSIRLGQILSPGAYLVWGLPWDIPLSLGIGSQYGPGLGKLDNDGGTVINNPRWRSNFFLAVDIPFYNLVNVPKQYSEYSSTVNRKKKK